jgi:hypothetical protein
MEGVRSFLSSVATQILEFILFFFLILIAGNEINWTYSFWAQQLSANFTRFFHVPKSPTSVDKRPDLINRQVMNSI